MLKRDKKTKRDSTLVNIYDHLPPESDKCFFKYLLDFIAAETEGVCICGGDLNLIMDHQLDMTSMKRNKKSLTKMVKNTLQEIGLIDIWRDLYPLRRDYRQDKIR